MVEQPVIDLTGDGWEIREALGLTWQWYVEATSVAALNSVHTAAGSANRSPGWIPASVPGSIIHDLAVAGEIADPYVNRNSRSAEWVADRSWVYRRTVHIDRLAARAVIELDGVDPSGIVFWDGMLVGRVDGLYHSTRIDLGARAGIGNHLLAIVVAPAPDSQPQVGRTDLVRVHSPRLNYGWDFSPRLRHQGIWREIRLLTGGVQFAAVSARADLDQRTDRGVVTVAFRLEGESPVLGELFEGDRLVAAVEVEGSVTELSLEVVRPRLWHPRGFGDQDLYRLRLSAGEAQRSMDIGFRSIVMEPNPGGAAGALPYSAVVNGVRVGLVGWNWVPVDTLHGSVSLDRLRHLLALAADSGARVLRVWGGGTIESEDFYNECDRLGMLVWQEFSQSSSGMQSAPATDANFLAMLRAEAEAIVPTRTHHPSLWMWGGGNELDENGIPLTEDRSPALAVLRDAVARLDPGRHWVATSPSGPAFHNRLDLIGSAPDDQHDVHGPWEYQGLEAQQTLYNAGTSLAHSEFGVEGMTNRRALEALIPISKRWPADRTNVVYRHLGEWWNNATLVDEVFGGCLNDLESLRTASQFLQATGLTYAIEADRRRAPKLSMVLPWQFSESYPNAWCTSAVDYFGEPKPAYFAVSRAFAPTRATVRTDRTAWAGHERATMTVWVWADHGVTSESVVTANAQDPLGGILASASFPVPAVTEPLGVGELVVDLANIDGPFAWVVEWRTVTGYLLDREVVLATAAETLGEIATLPPATAQTKITWRDAVAEVHVRHTGGPLIPMLRLRDTRPPGEEGALIVTGDPRPLLPGDERVLSVDFSQVRGRKRAALEGWNLEAIAIEADT
ncbi:MAG TPA: hypothetical protein VHZ81_08800 [Galbitalea sp.]|jgi:beta-mannosidase|nr:hypothetical protein [Galbitalea sp.]